MRSRRTVVVRGPLAPYGPGFGVLLVSRGYKPASVRCRLGQLNLLSRWLDVQGLGPTGLTDGQVERFVAARRAAGRVSCVSAANFALPLAYLRSLGVVPAGDAALSGGALEELLARSGAICASRVPSVWRSQRDRMGLVSCARAM